MLRSAVKTRRRYQVNMDSKRVFMIITNTIKHPQGSLWFCWRNSSHPSKVELRLTNDDDSEKHDIKCSISDVEEVTRYYALLFPLQRNERIEVFRDKKWLNEGISLNVGQKVKLINKKKLEGAEGILRFKDVVDNFGMLFGIELTDEHRGKGSSDGVFRDETYFNCDDNCGVFVNIFRIRVLDHQLDLSLKKANSNPSKDELNSDPSKDELKFDPLKNGLNRVEMQIGDRVVWLNDDPQLDVTKAEGGVVRWIGILEDATGADEDPDRKFTAGVEFDNPIGKGNGLYNNKQLFQTPRNHASLVPILGLMKETEYYGFPAVYTSLNEDAVDGLSSLEIDGSSDSSYDSLKSQSKIIDEVIRDNDDISVGDVIKVRLNNQRIGVVRWVSNSDDSKTGRVIVGIEMSTTDEQSYTSGSFSGEKKFCCAPHRAFFAYKHMCTKLTSRELKQIFGPDRKVVIPASKFGPQALTVQEFIGGIQGYEFSTFMDSTLLSLFATDNCCTGLVQTSSVSSHCRDVQNYLLGTIGKQLMDNLFVRADRVLRLRVLIQRACSELDIPQIDLSAEDNDPETFITILFQLVLSIPGFASTIRVPVQGDSLEQPFFVHHLTTSVFNQQQPQGGISIQNLIETNMLMGRLNFSPYSLDLMILKVHRSDGDQIIKANQVIDLSNLFAYNPRVCRSCGKRATLECVSCYTKMHPSLADIYHCQHCFQKYHCHNAHVPTELRYEASSAATASAKWQLQLFAIIAKENNHYTSFFQLFNGAAWYYSDSKGTSAGKASKYCKPLLTPVHDFPEFFNAGSGKKISNDNMSNLSHCLLTKSYMYFYKVTR